MITNRKPRGLMAQVIEQAARRLAQDSAVLAEHRQAFYERAVAAQHAAWVEARGQEYIKVSETREVYISAKLQVDRQARAQRILEALARGEEPREIASREGVTARLVRWYRASAGG